MLQSILSPRSAWWFTETIDSTTRGTPHSPPVAQKYSQSGFHLVQAEMQLPATIHRTLAQFILGDPFVAKLRATTVVPLTSVYDEHAAQWTSRKNPLGLEVPIMLDTSPKNESPQSPDSHVPPPLDALHYPTVTPEFQSLPNDPTKAPPTWNAAIAVKLGFATFKLDYTITWSDKNPKFPTATLTFPPQQKSDSKDGFTLTIKPSGGWTTTFRVPDLLPLASSGSVHYIVTAAGPGGESGELINRKLAFAWQLALVTFTDDTLVTQPWASVPLPQKPALDAPATRSL